MIAFKEMDKREKSHALLAGRAILSSAVAGSMPTAELSDDLKNAAFSAARSRSKLTIAALSVGDANRSAHFAHAAARSSVKHVVELVGREEGPELVRLSEAAANSTVLIDCSDTTVVQPPSCFESNLWPKFQVPSYFITNPSYELLSEIPEDGSPWSFWRNWYEGFLNGQPMDWELQKRVALIDDDVWEAGVEAVAAKIERIEATSALEKEISHLREMLHSQQLAPTTGHNLGPPLEENEVAIRSRFDLVWPMLEELEAEAAKDAPDASRLELWAQKLWDISIVILKYCGRKVDLAVDKTIETAAITGTKAAIATGATIYISSNEKIQSVAKAAWHLAKTLADG